MKKGSETLPSNLADNGQITTAGNTKVKFRALALRRSECFGRGLEHATHCTIRNSTKFGVA